jgi:hypothetical protein
MPDDILIDVYPEFGLDFLDLSEEAQTEVEALFKALAVNPYDPIIQRKSFLHGERFEYPLADGHSIFWRLEIDQGSILKMRVLISEIARRPKR